MARQIYPIDTRGLTWNDAIDVAHSVRIQPIALIINPSEDTSALAGETFELRVTVTNQGNKGAVINIYIDETSGLLRQWCASPFESLALANDSSAEVVFRFAIPANANPDNYSYLLVIDAPNHYPEDTPIRHEARLQVLPPVQSAVRVNDPTFSILPATSATQPAIVQPGEPFALKAISHNRSDRVDRFRLTCPDLPLEWFTAIYPEGLVELGLVVERESLALNPGAKGEIQLRLLFPLNMKAGNYSFTVFLSSVNNPDLVLMDVVYLQVLPTYRLTAELQTKIAKVGEEAGWFRLLLFNYGNTLREIAVIARENADKPICTYTFTPQTVKLGTQTNAEIDLRVKPNKWWRRPWFGKGRSIEFYVELTDIYQLPVSERLEGTLIWEARPLWQFILLILAGAGTLASLIFLLWWFFFRPPTPPKIREFASVAPVYQEAAGDAIYLNWQIREPQQIRTIKISGIAADSNIAVSPAVYYDFSKGIPRELKDFCTLGTNLICQNIRTDAQQAGTYIYQMEIFAKKGNLLADTQKTNTIEIAPLPLPKIAEFNSTQPVYQAAASNREAIPTNDAIALSWKIINTHKLQALKLIGRALDGTVISPLKTYNFRNGMPSDLKQFCVWQSELVCGQVPTNMREPGDYVFELFAVYKRNGDEMTLSQKTENIKIKPYQFSVKISSLTVNGQEASPKYIIPIDPKTSVKTLTVSWKVEGDKNTKVELQPVGTVPLQGFIYYPVSQQVGIETITLSVTGESGQKLSRTVTIEKVAPSLSQPTKPAVKIVPASPQSAKTPASTTETSPIPSNLPPASSVPSEKSAGSATPTATPNVLPSPNPAELSTPTPPPVTPPTQTKGAIAIPAPPTPVMTPLPAPPMASPTPLPAPPMASPTPSLPAPSPTPLPAKVSAPNPMELPPQFD